MIKFAIPFILALNTSAIALATELSNEDGKAYDLKVTEGSTTTNTTINGNSTRMTICSGKCTIELVGGASVDATDAATIKIKGGKFEVKK